MWPKLLVQYLPQLVELVPHLRRVVPMADKLMESRGVQDAKLDSMANAMRDNLGKVAKAHVEMATQLDGFASHVGAIEREAQAAVSAARNAAHQAELARVAAEGLEGRMTRMEKSLALQRTLLPLMAFVLLIAIALLVVVLLRQH